jgi:uncharacterized membrane-anchored protein
MNQYILLAVAIIGAILIFKKELLLQNIPQNINDKLTVVYQNNTIVGAVLIAGAYYFYTKDLKSTQPKLPSYTEATSELVSSQ